MILRVGQVVVTPTRGARGVRRACVVVSIASETSEGTVELDAVDLSAVHGEVIGIDVRELEVEVVQFDDQPRSFDVNMRDATTVPATWIAAILAEPMT